jgi:C-terminal processing protease CtpA/Prc
MAPVGLLLILLFLTNSSFGQLTSRQKRNLDAFARLYGYVRYFYPSDEVNKLNMARFAASGSLKMLAVKDDGELVNTMNNLFQPIAPAIKIYLSDHPVSFNINSITPSDTTLYNEIYWQHLGINSYNGKDSTFISERVNRQDKPSEINPFNYSLSDTLNLSPFIGKRFSVILLAKTTKMQLGAPKIRIEPWRDDLNNTKGVFSIDSTSGNIVSALQKKFTFSGIIDQDHPYVTWKIAGDASVPISIDSIRLIIEDNKKSVQVVFKGSPYTDKHPARPIAVYQLKLQRIDEPVIYYQTSLKMGDVIKKEIVPGISVNVPLCLYGNNDHTFPKAAIPDITLLETNMYNTVKKDKDGRVIDSGNELDIRLANIIMSWTVINNSYPYWSRASKTPLEILNHGLDMAMTDKTNFDFLATLKEMYKPLNDGLFQAFLNDPGISYNNFFAPVSLDKIHGNIIIASLADSTLSAKVSPGDVVISIDSKPATQLFQTAMQTTSGAIQWRTWQALQSLTARPENKMIELTVNHGGKNEKVRVLCDRFGVFDGRIFVNRNEKSSTWASPDIYYLNMANDSIPGHIKELQSAKAVIIDLRNDNLSHDNKLFNYFAKSDQHISLLSCPEIDYPDYQNVRYKTEYIHIKPQCPFTKQRLYFIIDASTKGVLEELAWYIKRYKLGKLIGRKTSGTFTGANTFAVLGDYQLSFTGLKVISSAGNKTEGGIVPDVMVKSMLNYNPIKAAIANAKKHM